MDKVRYMISDAADMVHVETHVLRYWEEELELAIPRNEMGHRYYTRDNIKEFQKHDKTRFYSDNFVESIEFDYLEIQIIEEDDANNIDYVIKLINRMERLVLGKMLNQINTIQAKLNYILNYR